MAKSAKSSKAKGRRLQNFVRDMLRDIYTPILHEDDIKSQTMGMTGEDIILTPAARKLIPFSFECKNVERLQMWRAIDQCETNIKDTSCPAILFKKNRKQPVKRDGKHHNYIYEYIADNPGFTESKRKINYKQKTPLWIKEDFLSINRENPATYRDFEMAGTPGNRTQLPIQHRDNGFEDRGGHQPHNHSQ